jgi:hypothetical protein
MNQQCLSSLIWSVADLLCGDYKQSEYGKVILPFTVFVAFGLRVGTDEGRSARRTGRQKEARTECRALFAP